jgi:CDP-diacylglycerol--glycerol-3-phosphate 3-phosphatidyltransferase
MEAFSWALHAPAHALARRRITPDALTCAALAIALASAPILASGHFAIGAAIVLAAGALDGLDGMVARAEDRACPAGAVLDSFVDRIADAAPLVGLALFYRSRVATLLPPLVAIIASSLVSYARAKADIYGLVLPQGLMRRHERIAYLSAALLASPLLPRVQLGGEIAYPIALAGVGFIGALSLFAAFRLVHQTRRALARAP